MNNYHYRGREKHDYKLQHMIVSFAAFYCWSDSSYIMLGTLVWFVICVPLDYYQEIVKFPSIEYFTVYPWFTNVLFNKMHISPISARFSAPLVMSWRHTWRWRCPCLLTCMICSDRMPSAHFNHWLRLNCWAVLTALLEWIIFVKVFSC